MSADTAPRTTNTAAALGRPNAVADRPDDHRRGFRHGWVGRLVTHLCLIVGVVLSVFPFWWLLVMSTSSNAEIFGYPPSLWFNGHAMQNVATVFSSVDMLRALGNTVLVSGATAVLVMLFDSLAAFAFAKYEFPAKEAVFWTILGGVLVPATVIALPLYFLLNAVGLTGSYWSVLLPCMVSPFGVYLARIHANASVPDEVIEAARIDGAGDLRIFGSIATRMMTPAIVTIFLFQFVTIWNNYLLPLVMLNDPKRFPITLGLTLWNSQTQRDPAFTTLVVTGSAVSVILLVVLMVSLQRFWKADLTAGATKG